MFKKVRFINLLFLPLIIVFMCVTLTSCMDSREIDEEVYAIALGIDKGVQNKVRITIQYPNYKSGGSTGKGSSMSNSSSQNAEGMDSIDAPSIIEGLNMLGMSVPRRISLMHTKLLVISEELAREGMGNYAGPIERFRETRGSMWVIVSKERAEEFLNANQVNIGSNLSKSIELAFEEAKYSNYFPHMQFRDFYESLLSGLQQPYAIYGAINNFKNFSEGKSVAKPPLYASQGLLAGDTPRKGSSKIEYAGMAVFDGDKMVGVLDTYETTYFLMMIGKFPAGKVTIEDKNAAGKVIVVDMRNGRVPKVKAHFEKGIPIIDVKIPMEADVESIQSRIHYEHFTKVDDLNKQLETSLLEGSKKLIEKTQKEFKSDVFGFGKVVVGSFSTIKEWEDYDWLSQYPKAKINIEYEVNIRRDGSMLQSEEIKHSKYVKSDTGGNNK